MAWKMPVNTAAMIPINQPKEAQLSFLIPRNPGTLIGRGGKG